MKLLFGIGNPGHEYDDTRHNVGIAFVEFVNNTSEEFECVASDVFVNTSGPIVKKLKTKYKLKNGDIIIAHDDLDIAFGNYKIAFDRSSAGHKGVQSVIDVLKTQQFWRVRIGTASPRLRSARSAGSVADYVLSKFTPTERKHLPEIFTSALHELSHRIAHP